MRISDWSSDVCSSDLEKAISDVDGDPLLAFGGEAVDEQREVDFLPLRSDALAVGFERGELILEDHFAVVKHDRKSVVSGKSVSVRVDLGGRRLIKKKNQSTETENIRNTT